MFWGADAHDVLGGFTTRVGVQLMLMILDVSRVFTTKVGVQLGVQGVSPPGWVQLMQ